MTPRGFDVVCVEFLLERVEYAELILDRMVNSLRPGGLLLLRVRDRESAYGFVDRNLPDWLRRRFGETLPAVYEPVCSREGLRAYCLMRGLMIAEDRGDTTGPARLGPRRKLVETVLRAVASVSRGRLRPGLRRGDADRAEAEEPLRADHLAAHQDRPPRGARVAVGGQLHRLLPVDAHHDERAVELVVAVAGAAEADQVVVVGPGPQLRNIRSTADDRAGLDVGDPGGQRRSGPARSLPFGDAPASSTAAGSPPRARPRRGCPRCRRATAPPPVVLAPSWTGGCCRRPSAGPRGRSMESGSGGRAAQSVPPVAGRSCEAGARERRCRPRCSWSALLVQPFRRRRGRAVGGGDQLRSRRVTRRPNRPGVLQVAPAEQRHGRQVDHARAGGRAAVAVEHEPRSAHAGQHVEPLAMRGADVAALASWS